MTMDIHALVGAYVLDAVDDIERAAFDRHLGTCRACAAEVDELREATARLADATWSVPPPRLRHEVMARVAVTRQVTPVRRAAARAPGRPAWGRRVLAAAAAVALAAGTGAAVFAYQDQRVREQAGIAAAARAQAARIEAVLAAPDARLRTAEVTGGGQVTVVVSRSRDEGVVLLADGAPPAPGQAYQMWLIDGAYPAPADVMPAGSGSGTGFVSSVRDTDVIALTIEPAAGSQEPTSPVRARVSLDF
ncbi:MULTISPECIES: anti-sigma factor [Catenuloplanes]|uniref:Regulator of SigK n=1 Tax=Catenuloplanes niger TaxID=587534 RepID=A0AAE3ZR73_9ACTN|nr:anti-sigma factor [Catenuloplanes niger]MDR7324573.1 anti-sigma-K factor RskA [Catenuloplanes niger]